MSPEIEAPRDTLRREMLICAACDGFTLGQNGCQSAKGTVVFISVFFILLSSELLWGWGAFETR